jgi:hypothetical protein
MASPQKSGKLNSISENVRPSGALTVELELHQSGAKACRMSVR